MDKHVSPLSSYPNDFEEESEYASDSNATENMHDDNKFEIQFELPEE